MRRELVSRKDLLLIHDPATDHLIRYSISVVDAVNSKNYYRFFKLYKEAPRMSGFILDFLVYRVRDSALKAIITSYSGTEDLHVSFIHETLGFSTLADGLVSLFEILIVWTLSLRLLSTFPYNNLPPHSGSSPKKA